MKILGILLVIWLSICTLVLLVFHIKSRRMIRSVTLNALLGLAAILIINSTQKFTGIRIPLNPYTVGGSGVFGLPCICGIILLQIMF